MKEKAHHQNRPAETGKSGWKRRVVVTGMGIISPLGNSVDELTEALKTGRSAGAPIAAFETDGFPIRVAAEVADFNPRKMIRQRKAIKMMSRDVQFGVAVAALAIDDSGLSVAGTDVDTPTDDPTRIGVSFGSGFIDSDIDELAPAIVACRKPEWKNIDDYRQRMAEAYDMDNFGASLMANLFPLWLLKYLPNMPACHVTIIHDLQGPNNSLTGGDAASIQAIGEAARIIERGSADVMVCGGTDCTVNPLSLLNHELFKRVTHRNDDPAGASRPFEKNRDGLLMGEGAAAVVLEEYERARARGATIYAEVVGYGCGCDAYRVDAVHPEARGAQVAMRAALRDARTEPEDISYLAAHGLSCVDEDKAETVAVREVFGGAAESLPVSAVKSMMGYVGSASGSMDLVCALVAMREGFIPPTINYEEPDPDCNLNIVANEPRSAQVNSVLINTFGLGGQAATLVIRRLN